MEFRQGLLWRVFTDAAGRTWVNHCGSVKGFNACLANYPAEDLVVAIMYNADDVSPGRLGVEELAKFYFAAGLDSGKVGIWPFDSTSRRAR